MHVVCWENTWNGYVDHTQYLYIQYKLPNLHNRKSSNHNSVSFDNIVPPFQFVELLPPWFFPLLSPALAGVFSSPAPFDGSGIGAVLSARATRVDCVTVLVAVVYDAGLMHV